MLAEKLLVSAVTAMPMLLGLGLIYEGYRQRRMAAEMSATEATPIGDIEAGDAPVAVSGEARPLDGTVSATMLGTDAVRVSTFAKRQERTPNDNRRWQFRSFYRNTDSVPWVIDDGTGQIAIEETGYGEVGIDTTSHDVGEGETPPESVQRLIDSVDDLSAGPDEKRRYTESAIEAGERVYAYGEAVARPEAPTDVVLTAEETPDQFVLTDTSINRVVDEKSSGGAFLYFVGGCIPFAVGAVSTAVIWIA